MIRSAALWSAALSAALVSEAEPGFRGRKRPKNESGGKAPHSKIILEGASAKGKGNPRETDGKVCPASLVVTPGKVARTGSLLTTVLA